MLTQPTIDILRKLRLKGLAEAYLRQLQDPRMNELTFEERFGLLIDHQWTERQNRQVNKLLREARLKVQASPEDTFVILPVSSKRGRLAPVFSHHRTCGSAYGGS
jgi:hypothetical protein